MFKRVMIFCPNLQSKDTFSQIIRTGHEVLKRFQRRENFLECGSPYSICLYIEDNEDLRSR